MAKENKSKIGILGYGEVGQAMAKFYGSAGLPKAKIKDLKRDDGLRGGDILHICIPWSDDFLKTAKKEIEAIKPKLVIVHSTVAPGTTKKLSLSLKKESGVLLVHSPVRGVHPNLYQGVKTFIKYIGADNQKAGEAARRHLEGLGIKTKVFMPSATTEIGKLLDTTYYGLCIAWHGEMKKICDEVGVDFEKAATDFNKTYNEGYKKLGMPNVTRPVLYPPKNGIGGHCILPNAKILKKYFKSRALDFILEYNLGKKVANL